MGCLRLIDGQTSGRCNLAQLQSLAATGSRWVIFDATFSYRTAFLNGFARNPLNLAIAA
jgi:hypothetical protein